MMSLFPVEASENAAKVDMIFFALLGLSIIIVLVVLALVVGFSVKYRQGHQANRRALPAVLSREWEVGWTSATLFLALFLFWWAGSSQLSHFQAPDNAMEIHVLAKQWMWKTKHASGAREINSLHVPVGVPIKLIMASEDVIHSFYVPAFRLKRDVVPGRYNETWFKATRPGVYRLFCAEYCGTDHSRMTGEIFVMSRGDFARWLAAQPQADDLTSQGAKEFRMLGCSGCHGPSGRVRAPDLAGLYGHNVPLSDGSFAVADEAYLRDSILMPRKQVVAGYDPVMPSFEGRISEEQLIPLIAFLKAPPSRQGIAR